MTEALRIDGHQHFWRYDAIAYPWIDDTMSALKRDFLPDHLKPEMSAAGVHSTIAVQAQQTLEETSWLLQLASANPFVAGVIGWVDLRAGDVRRQLDAMTAHRKLVGVRHIVQSEPDDRFLLRPDFCRGIAALREYGLAYDVLIYPRHLEAAGEFVGKFDGQIFVVDHLAKPEIRSGAIDTWARDLGRLARSPHVYCKVSGLVTEADWTNWRPEHIRPYLDVAFDLFGADRLIAGTDWPVCTVAAGYGQVWSLLTDFLSDRPAAERDAVLGGNAQRVWRLENHERGDIA